jgi:hypothetical protein
VDVLALCGLQNLAGGLFHDTESILYRIGAFTASACSGRHALSMRALTLKFNSGQIMKCKCGSTSFRQTEEKPEPDELLGDVHTYCTSCGELLTVDPDDPVAFREALTRGSHRLLRKILGIGEFDDDESKRN